MKKSNSDKVERIEDEILFDQSAIPKDFGRILFFPNIKLVACIYDPATDVDDPSSIWERLIKTVIENTDYYQHKGSVRLAQVVNLYSLEEPH